METNLEFAFNAADAIASQLQPTEMKKVSSGYYALRTSDGTRVYLIGKDIPSRWVFETNLGRMKGILVTYVSNNTLPKFVRTKQPEKIAFKRTKISTKPAFIRTKPAKTVLFTRTK